jgi:hypothetical protein
MRERGQTLAQPSEAPCREREHAVLMSNDHPDCAFLLGDRLSEVRSIEYLELDGNRTYSLVLEASESMYRVAIGLDDKVGLVEDYKVTVTVTKGSRSLRCPAGVDLGSFELLVDDYPTPFSRDPEALSFAFRYIAADLIEEGLGS